MTYIVEVTAPAAADSSPSRLIESSYETCCAKAMTIVGFTDQLDTPSDVVRKLANQQYSRRVHLLAVTGEPPTEAQIGELGFPVVAADDTSWPHDEVVGEFWGEAELEENTDTLDGEYLAADGADGVGSQLLAAVDQATKALGRQVAVSWTWHRGGGDDFGDASLISPTGEGSVPHDEDSQIHLDAGYRLLSVERQSRLNLPVSDEILSGFEARTAEGYVIEVTEDAVASGDKVALAHLLSRLSADAPHEGLDVAHTEWTEERFDTWETDTRHATRTRILALARHVDSGELVGYSELRLDLNDDPAVAFQIGTLVLPEHRGDGLGKLIKAAGLRHLQANYPERTRIDTWNSFDNAPMLAINVELGYFVVSTYGCWRKDV